MLRDGTPAPGRYRVEFSRVDYDGNPLPGEHNVAIGQGADTRKDDGTVLEYAPRCSESKPYEGELTEEELTWLRRTPGRDYNPHYRFVVTKLGKE